MKNLLSLFFFLSALMIISCGKDDETDGSNCETTDLTYNGEIKNILNTNCALSGCHSEDQATTQGAMHDYAAAKAFVDFGRVVGAINHNEGFKPMPFPTGTDKLSDCNIDKIEAWIADGAPEE
ncbi:MAG: hypothetical protein AB8F74_08295 [Saprospiraceae bacterium]